QILDSSLRHPTFTIVLESFHRHPIFTSKSRNKHRVASLCYFASIFSILSFLFQCVVAKIPALGQFNLEE
ncbi:hypothetical protein LINPERHAP1_LOCUS19790, partial [Linum perenne]